MGVGCLVIDAGSLLLVRRRATPAAGAWSPPAGPLWFGESLEDCAARATLESTGVRIANPTFIALTNDVFADEERHHVTLWVEARRTPTAPDDREAFEVAWHAFDRLPDPLYTPLERLLSGQCVPRLPRPAPPWWDPGRRPPTRIDDDGPDGLDGIDDDHWLA